MEKTVRLVVLGLVPRTSCTRSTIVSNKGANTWPSILSADQCQSLVDAKVSRDWMIMIGTENTETEIAGWRDVNPLVNPDEPKGVLRPSSILCVGYLLSKIVQLRQYPKRK